MSTKKKAAIVIDAYKLPIFERRLKEDGYTYAQKKIDHELGDSVLLSVETDNMQAIAQLCLAANNEAKGVK